MRRVISKPLRPVLIRVEGNGWRLPIEHIARSKDRLRRTTFGEKVCLLVLGPAEVAKPDPSLYQNENADGPKAG
jgi:hypothetical protein